MFAVTAALQQRHALLAGQWGTRRTGQGRRRQTGQFRQNI